jgi:hypothetical protein
LAVIFADDGQYGSGFIDMADLYFDCFTEPKPTTVHKKNTVAIYRMLDRIDDPHAIFMRKCLWQPRLA